MSVGEGEAETLVGRAKTGDASAWELLYRRVYPRLLAYAGRRLDPDQAKDAVSETLARAVAAIDGFEPRAGGFDAWLFGICRHVVLDTYRANARRGSLPPPDRPLLDADPVDGVMRSEEAAAVRLAFERLDADDRELLELRVMAGLSAEEVAAVLGKRPGAVRMAQSRALARLRRHLAEVHP